MNERHQIMADKMFWGRLEREVGAWLNRNSQRGIWFDCLAPEYISDTKQGVDVTGAGVIDYGDGTRMAFRFIVSIPQKMLHRRRQRISIDKLTVDESRQTLEITVTSEKQDS
jgi:hypothetical protein